MFAAVTVRAGHAGAGAVTQQDFHARQQRALDSFLQRHQRKLSGRDERIAKAEAKRARKNAKRARDAMHAEIGQRAAREWLDNPVSQSLYVVCEDGSFLPLATTLEGIVGVGEYGPGPMIGSTP